MVRSNIFFKIYKLLLQRALLSRFPLISNASPQASATAGISTAAKAGEEQAKAWNIIIIPEEAALFFHCNQCFRFLQISIYPYSWRERARRRSRERWSAEYIKEGA
jgi:hypothetical protein